MRTFIHIITLSVLFSSCGNSPKETQYATQETRDSILISISNRLKGIQEIHALYLKGNRFKLYKTENMYNLLELDTWTGRIWQIQWTLNDDTKSYEYSTVINSEDLANGKAKAANFELQPTDNMYQFLLLDKVQGRVWHVQWGLEDDHRWIRLIP